MRRYFSETDTSARVIMSLSAAMRLVRSSAQERHVQLHEVVERRDHLLHHRQRFARRRFDFAELARHRRHFGLLRLHLLGELVVVGLEAADLGVRLAIFGEHRRRFAVERVDALLRSLRGLFGAHLFADHARSPCPPVRARATPFLTGPPRGRAAPQPPSSLASCAVITRICRSTALSWISFHALPPAIVLVFTYIKSDADGATSPTRRLAGPR